MKKIYIISIIVILVFTYQITFLKGRLTERISQRCPTIAELRRVEDANEKLIEIYKEWVNNCEADVLEAKAEVETQKNNANYCWGQLEKSEEELTN